MLKLDRALSKNSLSKSRAFAPLFVFVRCQRLFYLIGNNNDMVMQKIEKKQDLGYNDMSE